MYIAGRVLIFVFLGLYQADAMAACATPNGALGSLDFQSGVFKYCDGTNWTDLSWKPSTSAAVASQITDETGTGSLVFGTSPTLKSFVLGGATSGGILMQVAATGATGTYTWPAATPASNMVLQSDNTGSLSWIAAGGGSGSPGGANSQLQFNSSGTFAGDSSLTWDNSSKYLTIETSDQSPGLSIKNTSSSTARYPSVDITNYGAGYPELYFMKANGTSSSPSATLAFDELGSVNFMGHDGSGDAYAGSIEYSAADDFTATSRPTNITFWKSRAGVTSAYQALRISAEAHIQVGSGGIAERPTVSACGTSPVITGNDTRGRVTLGTATPTSCTITFKTPFENTPFCVVTPHGSDLGSRFWIASASTSAFTIGIQTGVSSKVFSYICME